MDFIPIQIQDWLLKSILGIICLGAVGSIVGALIVYVIVNISKKIYDKRQHFLLWLLLPLGRKYEEAKALRGMHLPFDKSTSFQLLSINAATNYIVSTMLLLMSLGFMIYIILEYQISRPIALSVSIGFVIYFIYDCLKLGMFSSCLLPIEIDHELKAVEKMKKKTITEWKAEIFDNRQVKKVKK